MLTALRHQLTKAMEALHPSRKPALRRADSDDWLLCTDLPGLVAGDVLDGFRGQLGEMGCTTALRKGWLYVDAPLPVPPEAPLPTDGEAACLASLLLRHGNDRQDPNAARALVKAHEQGRIKTELLCRQLHGQWAAQLRRHEPLPGALLPYVCYCTHFND